MLTTAFCSDMSSHLVCRVKAKGPTSAQHLWEFLQDCWKTFSGDYLMKIIERMPRVCKAVIKAKDGYLKEDGYFEESKI